MTTSREQRVARSWDDFYANRGRRIPFFVDLPDAGLATWLEHGLLPTTGRALDLGCGAGRNLRWLARQGWRGVGVDLSAGALAWAQEQTEPGLDVSWVCGDVLTLDLDGPFDHVHDSGCLHHLAPADRLLWRDRIFEWLSPGGTVGVLTFHPTIEAPFAEDAPDHPPESRQGWGFRASELVSLLEARFEIVELRRMRPDPSGRVFAVDFLWEVLARRPKPEEDLPEAGDAGGEEVGEGTLQGGQVPQDGGA